MELSDSVEALKCLSEANDLEQAMMAASAFPGVVADTNEADPMGTSPLSLECTATVGGHRLHESDGSYNCTLCGDTVDAIPEDETPSAWAERRCRLYAYGYFKQHECCE